MRQAPMTGLLLTAESAYVRRFAFRCFLVSNRFLTERTARPAGTMLNLSQSELGLYNRLFQQCDLGGNEKITGSAVKDLFKQSGLPAAALKQVI